MIRPVDCLIEFLEAEQARGVTHVHLDEGARGALRELFSRTKGKPAETASAVTTPAAPMERIRIEAPEPVPAPEPATVLITGDSRVERLESLQRQAETWPPARNLGTLRDVMVFASGNPDARLMLVADAPGYHEERSKTPLSSDVGEKLDRILKAMGLLREEIYITHLVKFRPAAPRQTTNSRQLTSEEMAAFLPILAGEIDVIRPECIIALGETAGQGLLGTKSGSETLRGAWHEFQGVPVRVSLHPGRLLQTTAGDAIKRQLWEDMLEVMRKLAMPISDKQLGYFLPKA